MKVNFYKQIQTYFDEVLSKYQCGLYKGFNAQCCLVSMIEKWRGVWRSYDRTSLKLLTVYIIDY